MTPRPVQIAPFKTHAKALQFFVPGIPATAGSKRAFPFRKANGALGVRVTDSCARGKSWRDSVIAAAIEAGASAFIGPISLTCQFFMPRPKGHHVGGDRRKTLTKSAPEHHTTKPDVTKMVRAIEDALKGIVWHDDSQVVFQHNYKWYADDSGERDVGASVQIESVGGGWEIETIGGAA